MKLIYKILITLGIIMVVGNGLYLFTWTRDMLRGFSIGCIIGIISSIIGYWLLNKNK